jgi:hypothetical protein
MTDQKNIKGLKELVGAIDSVEDEIVSRLRERLKNVLLTDLVQIIADFLTYVRLKVPKHIMPDQGIAYHIFDPDRKDVTGCFRPGLDQKIQIRGLYDDVTPDPVSCLSGHYVMFDGPLYRKSKRKGMIYMVYRVIVHNTFQPRKDQQIFSSAATVEDSEQIWLIRTGVGLDRTNLLQKQQAVFFQAYVNADTSAATILWFKDDEDKKMYAFAIFLHNV